MQKLTTLLVTHYRAICIEALNVKGMQRGKLAKSVSDMAFGELRRQIEYKAAMLTGARLPLQTASTQAARLAPIVEKRKTTSLFGTEYLSARNVAMP